MTVFEAVCMKQPRTAIDIIVTYRLDDLAKMIGLDLVEKKNGTVQLMNHNYYRRVGRRVRQAGGAEVIA